MSKRKLKDFELETGVEIKTKDKGKVYSKNEFKKLIKSKYITVKTKKGLEYINNI